ncbi:MAG: class I tRNA ligase family protein, partial [Minisyncoccia bacterium]
YVMTVIGNALFGKTPFENVIVNGLILAEDGKKMSKSLKNYPDPMYMFNTAGADAMRLYMMNSPVVRAEEFAFSEKGVREVASKVMGRLRNTMSLYQMYAGDVEHTAHADSTHVLDQWIISRMNQLLVEVTTGLDAYELDRAARPIFEFVDDFSTWYVRRSRDRYKGEDIDDKTAALATTRYVFETVSKIVAPFVPFVADELWQELRATDDSLVQSVHLADWPVAKDEIPDQVRNDSSGDILVKMQNVREMISVGLQMRSESKMKVRQALASFTLPLENIPAAYHEFIIDEMNVKTLIDGELALDIELTDELIAEGQMRDLLRQIQSLRKQSGLQAHDTIDLVIQTSNQGQVLMEKFSEEIKKTAGIAEFKFSHNDGEEIQVGELMFIVAIEK